MRHAIVPFCVVMLALVGGCSSSSVEVVDLNKVLDIFSATLTELDGKKTADVTAKADGDKADSDKVDDANADGDKADGDKAVDEANKAVVGIEVVDQEDKAKSDSFVKLFQTKLNAAKLVSSPISVKIEDSGIINGFANNKSLFTIEIDAERNRVVASDGAGHYRDHSYHRSHGLFTGFFLGRMLSRNRSYYTGARAGAKPNYGAKSMSPKGYHASAVSKARASARTSSSRSKSGSKGVSFGK